MESSGKSSTLESLLGVLSVGPMSGYEIRQFMEQSTANFWSESFGQIYPALKRMLADGLVTTDGQPGEGHPAKKVYRLTDAGEARLRDWLGIPAKPRVPRSELLLKVFFGDRARPGAIARHVEDTRQRYQHDLLRYAAIAEQLKSEHCGNPALPYWLMTLRYGMAEAKAVLGWCEETLVELEQPGTDNRK